MTIQVPNKTDDPILLSEMANTVKKIKLETRDGGFLEHVKDVKLHRDRLFVTDSKISIFDIEGNFIQLLGKQGEGPGEYQRVNSMDVDRDSGRIFVSAYNKLLIYGPNYELVEERKLDYPLGYVKVLDGDVWLVSEKIGVQIGNQFANQTNIYKMNDNF